MCTCAHVGVCGCVGKCSKDNRKTIERVVTGYNADDVFPYYSTEGLHIINLILT